jgi:hypothetical protein
MVMALLLCGAPSGVRAFGVSGFASASYPFTTLEVPLANVADQVVGPVQNANTPAGPPNPGTYTTQASEVATTITGGALAVALGTETEALGFGPIVSGGALGRAEYDEYVTVSSASVANGTPVTVRVRYRIAFGAAAFHDLPPAEQSDSQQYARIDLNLDAQLGTTSTTHRWFQTGAGTSIVNGLFLDPTQFAEATIDVPVGQTVRVRFRWNDYANSDVRASSGNPTVFPSAQTGGTAAVVFGVESDTPGVTITSPLLGGPMPDFSGVTAASALAHVLPITVGAPVTVPEPDALSLGAVACLALSTRRCYAASHASA